MIKFPLHIQDYINSQRTAVLAVPLANKDVHAAAMLFSYHTSQAEFYFFTESGSNKMQAFKVNNSCRAAMVIGTNEENKKTLQMSGQIFQVKERNTLEAVKIIHYARYPESIPFENQSTVFLSFAPNWYRFTDYQTRPPKIITSPK